MLKKENRLKKNRHFKYIYKHGETKVLNKLSLVYIKTKFKTYKVGFSVSKKVGKSVVRNKIKRRLRECFLSLSNVSENEDTEYKIINGVRYYRLSELRKTDKVVINGSTYMYDLKSIPTYENVINSPDYSFIYEDSWVQNNIVYVKYISESEKDSIVYSVEYDIFNKIQNIDSKKWLSERISNTPD